jgi:hypothetical protein
LNEPNNVAYNFYSFHTMKKFFLSISFLACSILPHAIFAQGEANDFLIIPVSEEQDIGTKVQNIGKDGGQVRSRYNQQANEYQSRGEIGNQIASGVFTRDTILNYVVYLIRFLSQLGLLIGGIMIIYAGYIYASSIFTGQDASKANTAIKRAITGVVIIASSYAIMRILTNAFLT